MLHATTSYRGIFGIILLSAFLTLAMRDLNAQPALWESVGPYGGGVSSFASIGSSVFACSDNGIFKTTDNGDSWQKLPYQFGDYSVWQLIAHDSYLFALGDRAYRSTDNGDTWTNIDGKPDFRLTALCFIGDTLYAHTYENVNTSVIYRSYDYGTSWQTAGQAPVGAPAVLASHGNALFLSIGGGFYRSDNGGRTWDTINFEGNVYAFAAHDSTLVVVEGGVGTARHSIYYSLDFGSTWSHSNFMADVFNSVIWDGSRFIASGGNAGSIFISADGVDWQRIKVGPAGYITTTYVHGTTLFAGSIYMFGGSIYRSTDNGATWSPANKGFLALTIDEIVEHSGMLFAAREDGGIYMSRDYGSEWAHISTPLTDYTRVTIASTGDAILVAKNSGGNNVSSGMYRTADAGTSWTRVEQDIDIVRNLAVSGSLAAAVVNTRKTYKYLLYTSTDGGVTWSLKPEPPIDAAQGGWAFDLEIAGNTIFLATDRGLYRSLDTGMTWQPVNNGLGSSSISKIAITNGVLFAGIYKRDLDSASIFRSSDNGDSWQPVYSNDIPQDWVTDFAFHGNTIIASFSQSGIMRSADNGNTWTPFNNGLANTNARAVEFAGGNLFASVLLNGIYRTPIPSSARIATEPDKTATTAFYPNPCHGSATIRYDVPSTTGTGRLPVVLSLHTALGEVVDVPLSQYQAPGSYSTEIDVSGLAPGTYFYQVRTGARCETRSFIVMDR